MAEIFEFLSDNILLVIIFLVVIFIMGGVTYANYAFDRYQNCYNELKKHKLDFNGNAYDFANFLSETKFQNAISVSIQNQKELKSNGAYIPSKSQVALGEEVAYDNSIASFSVVAHEFGHALQHYKDANVLKGHYHLLVFVKFLGILSHLIIVAIILTSILGHFLIALIGVGILVLFFIIALCLKLSTINLEKDASAKAIDMVKELKMFDNTEIKEMERFLHYAKGTYIADFFRALLFWTGLVHKTKIF